MTETAPHAAARPARLYYDAHCGPCSLFANAVERSSRGRVRALPYDGDDAARELGDLSAPERFAYAHLVDRRGRTSGAAILPPILGLTVGAPAERLAERAPPIGRALAWLYDRFWNHRRTRGCAAAGPAVPAERRGTPQTGSASP